MEKKSSSSKFKSLKEFLSSTRSLNHQNNYETGLKKSQHSTSNFRSSIRNTKNSISLFNLIAASGGNDRLGGTSGGGGYDRPVSMALDEQYGYAYEDREIAPRSHLPNKSVSMYGLGPVDSSPTNESSNIHPSSSTRNLAARLFYNLRSKFRRRRRDRNKIVDSKSTDFGTLFPEDENPQCVAPQSDTGDVDSNAVKPTSARYQLKSANSLETLLNNSPSPIHNNNGAITNNGCSSSRTENNYQVTEPSIPGTSTASRSNNYANDNLGLTLKLLAESVDNPDNLDAGRPPRSPQVATSPVSVLPRDTNPVAFQSASPKPAKCLSKELEDLLKYGWYWGSLSKAEAELKLKDQPDGAFIVRDSSSDHYLLSLSFNSSNGKTLHTRIEYRNGQFCFYMTPDADSFNTVAELIEHCIAYSEVGIFCYSKLRRSQNPSTSYPVRLTKPISRFTEVKSLLYLSRLVIRQYVRFDLIPLLPLPPSLIEFVSEQRYI